MALTKLNSASVIDRLPVGSVLQTVQGVSNSEVQVDSTSFTKCTQLSASITPRSTSSKILIQIMGTVETDQYTRHLYLDICRSIGGGSDNVNLSGETGGLLNKYDGGTTKEIVNGNISYLDSPNTTSQIVYNPSMRYGGGNSPGADFGKANVMQTIILQEIKG